MMEVSKRLTASIVLPILLCVCTVAPLESWSQTDNEHIKFTIKNAGISVDGMFKKFDAVVKYDPQNPSASSFSGTINVSSLSTGIDMRDEHLLDEDYFSAKSYPNITFGSSSISKLSDGRLKVTGKLTMKGTTKSIEMIVKPTKSGDTWYFETTLTLDRLDFGVGEDSWVMGDDVYCTIKVAAN